MREHRAIKQLRRMIPDFTTPCKPGCHDCCGPVPFSPWERKQAGGRKPTNGQDCGFLTETGCSIYEHRPIMCRLYGCVKPMKCPHGAGPRKMIGPAKAENIMKRYVALVESIRAKVELEKDLIDAGLRDEPIETQLAVAAERKALADR